MLFKIDSNSTWKAQGFALCLCFFGGVFLICSLYRSFVHDVHKEQSEGRIGDIKFRSILLMVGHGFGGEEFFLTLVDIPMNN